MVCRENLAICPGLGVAGRPDTSQMGRVTLDVVRGISVWQSVSGWAHR